MIFTFELFLENENIYYHGTDNEHLFKSHEELTLGSFISKDYHFASDYGKYIYSVKLLTNNIFKPSKNDNHLEELFNRFDLTDPYNNRKVTKDEFQLLTDTWEILEKDSIINWIKSKYDGVELLEGGYRKYISF